MTEMAEKEGTVLIIDDSVESIRLISAILSENIKLLFATDGMAGMHLAEQQRPDLILLDVEMPEMNGYEVSRALKSDSRLCNIPVIFITGNTGHDHEVAALDAGAVDFVAKPLNPPVLKARVRTHLRVQQQNKVIEQNTLKDGFTGLYNRRYFDVALERELSRHQRLGQPLALALIDIDHFKEYNDYYGHVDGDRCLLQVAHCIQMSARRPSETVARYGGEEFSIILPHTDSDTAKRFAEHLCASIRALNIPHLTSGAGAIVTISAGIVSEVPARDYNAPVLIGAADAALYQAKLLGRNRAVVVAGTGNPDRPTC